MSEKIGLWPMITVIAPAYNAAQDIRQFLDSILQVDYPKDKLQIIIADNNSQDGTKEIIKEYPVLLVNEDQIQSSYAARNKALAKANGEIIAFTDSDCLILSGWIKEGIKAMDEENADLVGGKIDFIFSERPTATEYFDAMTHLQNEFYIDRYSGCVTANLFSKASVFEAIGAFDIVISGGDMIWTQRATNYGFKLVYAPKAIVEHPTRRTLSALCKKANRIGTGTLLWSVEQEYPSSSILYNALRSLLPFSLKKTRDSINERGTEEMNQKILRIWVVSYFYNFVKTMALLKTFFLGFLTRSFPKFQMSSKGGINPHKKT